MTQEEKQLLLKDICGRLLHGLKVLYGKDLVCQPSGLIKINNETCFTAFGVAIPLKHNKIKPYLRPMSSMTEEELRGLLTYSGLGEHEIEISKYDGGAELEFWLTEAPCTYISKVIDWLNKNMFDYRGLIPMGLALKASKDMYNIK